LRRSPFADRAVREATASAIDRAEVPYVYLLAPPLIVAYKKGRLTNLTIHPSDLYFLDRTLSVQG
jgi:hypothetical protein